MKDLDALELFELVEVWVGADNKISPGSYRALQNLVVVRIVGYGVEAAGRLDNR